MKPAAILLALGIALASSPAKADMKLSWNACANQAGASSNVTFACQNPESTRVLYGSFQADEAMGGFVALGAVLDVRVAAPTLPPFWHFEAGGCNAGGAEIFDAASGSCAQSANPWGTLGGAADAFVTAYSAGYGAPNRARMLLAVSRASSDPFPIQAGTDYFAFRLTFGAPEETVCAGCDAAADIVWSSGTLYSNADAQDLEAPSLQANRVTVNGGLSAMTLFGIAPAVARNDSVYSLTIRGIDLESGAAARLLRAGESDILGLAGAVSGDGTTLIATFDVRERAAGNWDVVVTNPLGDADTLRGMFQLVEATRLVSVDPDRALSNGWIRVTVHGYGLIPGATLAFEKPGLFPIYGFSPTVSADGRTVAANFELTGKPSGSRDVVVRQPDGSSQAITNGFLIVSGSFRLHSIAPAHGVDTTEVTLVLVGEGMLPGLEARLLRDGQTPIVGTDVFVADLGDTANATFDLAGRQAGVWTVELENPDGLPSRLIDGFTVHVPRAVQTVAPTVGGNLSPIRLDLTGNGFVPGTRVALVRGATSILEVLATFAADGRTMSATFDVTNGPTGLYDVVVTFPFQEQLRLLLAFELRDGIRTLSIAPASGTDTTIVPVMITGTGFVPGATATLRATGLPVIVGTTTSVSGNGLSLGATFDLRDQPGGVRDVRVTNPDSVFATLAAGFALRPVPRPQSIVPAVGFDSDTVAVQITGAGFATGLTVQLVRGAEVIAGAGTNVESPTSLRSRFPLQGRAPGLWDVRVASPAGDVGTIPAAFEIVGRLAASSISPTSAADDVPVALTVLGHGMVSKTTVSLRRTAQADIAGTAVSVSPNGNTLTATFDVAGRLAGRWDVFVRNPDAQTATLPLAFTLLLGPNLVSIAPQAAGDDDELSVTVAGSNFADMATLRLERAGSVAIEGTALVVATDGTSIQAQFDLTDRALGAWDVVVTNPGSLRAGLPAGFEIRPVFRLLSITPSSGAPEPDVVVTVIGRWILPGASVKLMFAGQPDRVGQAPTVAADGRSLIATFDLTGAPFGDWDVVVTNPGGATITLPSGFGVAVVAHAGLDLGWSGCSTFGSRTDDIVFDCAGFVLPELFANFQSDQPMPGFVALEAVLDIRVEAPELPPFWHFESNGCNTGAVLITDDRDESLCPPGTNPTPWSPAGQASDAYITGYGPGFHGPNRARMLVAVARASSDPFPIEALTNYYGFQLTFAMDHAETCEGCQTPAEIVWSSGTLHSNDSSVRIDRPGINTNRVSVNGGGGSMRIFDVAPVTVLNDVVRVISAKGYGMAPDASIRLERAGEAPIPGLSPVVSGVGRTLSASFDVRQRASGPWSVVVTNPSGPSDILHDAVEVIEAFRLVSVDPQRGSISSFIRLTVEGFGILPGASVVLEGGTSLPGYSPVVGADGRTVSATFDLTDGRLGFYDVVVRQPSGEVARLEDAFQIRTGFTLLSIRPVRGVDTSDVRVTLAGHGLEPGLATRLARAGQSDIPGQNIVVAADGDSAHVTFALLGRALGAWNVIVTNADSVSATLGNGFSIVPVRNVTAVVPSAGGNTSSIRVAIAGAGFVGGSSASLMRSGVSQIVGSQVVVAADGRSIDATFAINGKPVGFYDVVVSFPDNDEARLVSGFEVREGLRITNVMPVSAPDTSVVAVTVLGSGFRSPATAELRRSGETVIAGAGTRVAVSGDSLFTTFDLRGRAAGSWSLFIANSDGQLGQVDSAFAILPVPRPTGVSPASAFDNGATTLLIQGSAFVSGANVRLVRGSETIPGTATLVLGPGSIRTTVQLLDRTLGLWDVEVIQGTGLRGTLAQAFEILPYIRLTSVSPTSAPDAASVLLVVTGRNLAAGATAWLQRSGQANVPGASPSVAADGRSLSATFGLAGQRAGAWDVVVRNPNGQADTLASAFTILGTPAPQAVSPSSSGDDGSEILTVTGSNFSESATFALERGGETAILATAVVVTQDGSSMNGQVELLDRALGDWDVVVTQNGGLSGRITQGFEIRPALRVTSVAPNAALEDEVVTLVVRGRYFESGAAVRLARAGFADLVCQVVQVEPDGRSLTATVDLAGAPIGYWDVVVSNLGGASASLIAGFQIRDPVPATPLSLLWGACNEASPPGTEDILFDCENPAFQAHLFGNFRSPVTVADAIAFSAVLDLGSGSAILPPFWHMEGAGCNPGGLSISDDRNESVCPAARNATPWGPSGAVSDAFITAYGAGFGGPSRARLLIAVVRASGDPVQIVADENYFAFELIVDASEAQNCSGCESPISIAWSVAVIETPTQAGSEAIGVVINGQAGFPYVAKINGGVGDATPTRLSAFEAEAREDGIEVSWQFGPGGDFTSVAIERGASGSGEWVAVFTGQPASEARISVIDRDVAPGIDYEYRLVATRRGGGTQTFGPIAARALGAAAMFEFLSIAPNPMRDRTTIDYALSREALVRISVVDVQGRERSRLAYGMQSAGRHTAAWDGRFDGSVAPTGVYFIRCELDGRALVRRVAIVH